MKESTVKLSGHAKDRFLERFFGEEADLSPGVRERLVARSKSAFTSLRVRKAMLNRPRVPVKAPRRAPVVPPAQQLPPAATSSTAVTPAAAAAETTFDPYVFGLVPVFQREGREGLLAKLGGVEQIDHLRQMAKAQQIVLPQELRAGEATAQAIRTGIVEAVAKRIKDRRAAAG